MSKKNTALDKIWNIAEITFKFSLGAAFCLAASYTLAGVVLNGIDKAHAKQGNPNIDLGDLPIGGPIFAPFDYKPTN